MLLRYFADDCVYEIRVPGDARVEHRSHRPVSDTEFLDDLLLVPCEGRHLALPGEALPALAQHRMHGLRLVSARPLGETPAVAHRRGGGIS